MHKLVSVAAALLKLVDSARAETNRFELRTFRESPVVFAGSANAVAPGVPGRQLVTIRNDGKKSVAAVMFEQSVANGSIILGLMRNRAY